MLSFISATQVLGYINWIKTTLNHISGVTVEHFAGHFAAVSVSDVTAIMYDFDHCGRDFLIVESLVDHFAHFVHLHLVVFGHSEIFVGTSVDAFAASGGGSLSGEGLLQVRIGSPFLGHAIREHAFHESFANLCRNCL